MIEKDILDAVLPVPDLMELKDQKTAELKEEGFAITNFHSQGQNRSTYACQDGPEQHVCVPCVRGMA